SVAEKEMWIGGWVEKLTQRACNSGAVKILDQSNHAECIILSDMEDTASNRIPAPTKTQPKQSESRKAAAAERAERVRKADYLARKKEQEIESGKRDVDGKIIQKAEAATDDALAAALKRALRTGQIQKHGQRLQRQKKVLRTTKKMDLLARASYLDYILAAAKAEGMESIQKHPTLLVQRLQETHSDPRLFDHLYESTVGQWLETHVNGRACWKPGVLLCALKESGDGGHGRSKKLIKSPRMVVNADKTGISLLPTGKKAWETTGTNQINSLNHDEKRQSVWDGKVEKGLPNKNAPRREEADNLGFTSVHGDKRHWSLLDTTKQWVESTLIPYFKRVREEEALPLDSPGGLYNHSNIKLLFVPAGCTGEFRPADTLLQQIIKHKVKTASQDYFIACSTRQLQAGVAAEDVILPNDLPTLRDASVLWTLDAFNYMNDHPEVVRKAWELCRTGLWNFTWEKLPIPEAKDLLYTTLASNAEFRNELGLFSPTILRSTHGLPQTQEPDEDLDEAQVEFGGPGDDVTTSTTELVEVLTCAVPRDVRMTDDGGWTRFGDEGDIEEAGMENTDDVLDRDGEEDGCGNSASDNEEGLSILSDTDNDIQQLNEHTTSGDGTDDECAAGDANEQGASEATYQSRMDEQGAHAATGSQVNRQISPATDAQLSKTLHPGTAPVDSVSQLAEGETDRTTHVGEQECHEDSSNTPATYALDIAVLGGTHPAIYTDVSPPKKRICLSARLKKVDADYTKNVEVVEVGQSTRRANRRQINVLGAGQDEIPAQKGTALKLSLGNVRGEGGQEGENVWTD
ncbi:hypothetical protein FRC07_001275, partial [Ceratobasidium sp. 392]